MPAVPLMIAMSPTGELCCSSRCCALLVLLPRGATSLLLLCIRASAEHSWGQDCCTAAFPSLTDFQCAVCRSKQRHNCT